MRANGSVYQRRLASGGICATWTIKFYDQDGVCHRVSTKTEDRKEAERQLAVELGKIAAGTPTIKRAAVVTYEEIRDELVGDYRATGKRDLHEVGKRLAHLNEFFAGWKARDIDRPAINRYITHRQRQRVPGGRLTSNGTIQRELTVLSKMLGFAVENRRIAVKPKFPRLTESAPRAGFVDQDKFERVRKHLAPDLQVVVMLGYTYGLRHGEILGLDWPNIDFSAREIRLDVGSTKNGEGRVLVFTPEVEALLREQRARVRELEIAKPEVAPVACVFPYTSAESAGRKELVGTRRQSFGKAWKRATRAAGVPGLLVHDLRRSAVRNMVRAGVSETVAMKTSGHKTRAVFERYNITAVDDLRDAAAKISAFQIAGGSR
jgi:integrase